jgi:serine-type D-Ala-D-Ala carboxypeptidase/endopeptidase (penicillin-binding protein 4)
LDRPARTALLVIGVFALLSSGLASPALASASISLSSSGQLVTFGDRVVLSGSVVDDAACLPGREVLLDWRPADGSSPSTTVDSGTTAGDGRFSFTTSPDETGRFSVAVTTAGPCGAASSAEVLVRVRAKVDASVAVGSVHAGGCVRVTSTVAPPKPGETVELQRRAHGGWSTIDTPTLDDGSTATGRACFGWPDLGVVRLRVRWPAQDPLNETNASGSLSVRVSEAPWMSRIERLVAGRSMSVSVGRGGEPLFEQGALTDRTPASNEKLLLSMALLDAFGPSHEFPTIAATSRAPHHGVLRGTLWILGRGDPEVDAASMGALARRVHAAGIVRIQGRVAGSTTFFRRDWDAPGWRHTAHDDVNRPTALTFGGNASADPEREAAQALTNRLERLGVRVSGRPSSGVAPSGLDEIATIRSRPLGAILRSMLRPSINFDAEVLGKALGAEISGPPGTIPKGAAAIASWVHHHGESSFRSFDGSGLSYADRVTAAGIVRLLSVAETQPWGDGLRSDLPRGGQGTLEDRLKGVRVRAKTGTLDGISALSGWVVSRRTSGWVEFSILSSGMDKSRASHIEDQIVKVLHRSAR